MEENKELLNGEETTGGTPSVETPSEEVSTMYTIENYLRSIIPNAKLSDDTIRGILADACVAENTPVIELTEKQKDLSMAYLYIRVASNPILSSKVTERDADWEHSEGNEQWSRSQLQQFLILARELLAKWGLTSPLVESIVPKWGMVGRGHRNIRTYNKPYGRR